MVVVSGYILIGLSLFLAWHVHMDGIKILAPLFLYTLALLFFAFAAVVSLWQLSRSEREASGLYIALGCLAVVPLALTFKQYLGYSGAPDQFLLKFLMSK